MKTVDVAFNEDTPTMDGLRVVPALVLYTSGDDKMLVLIEPRNETQCAAIAIVEEHWDTRELTVQSFVNIGDAKDADHFITMMKIGLT